MSNQQQNSQGPKSGKNITQNPGGKLINSVDGKKVSPPPPPRKK